VTRNQKRILIVEDHADLRRMLRTVLTVAGFAVREAGDGYEALHMVDRDAPDLIVLDLNLPGVSGVSVRQEIAASATTRHIPIVVVTGSYAPADLDVACVLQKPIDPDNLVQTVRRCLSADGRVGGS
jgi:CheY-like chemotaxis protein